MPLHPQAQQILDQGKLLPPLETIGVAAARQRCIDAFCHDKPEIEITTVQDWKLDLEKNLSLPGVRNLSADLPPTRVPVRFYKPAKQPGLPILVYFHGGGYVVNNLDTHDGICRHLANESQCIVISAEYSKAPEHPYPAALQQCYAATCWVAAHAEEFGGNPQMVAVGGDSSGGTLAASVCLMARDLKGPDIGFQLLIYPTADFCTPGTTSYDLFSTGYSLTRPIMEWFYRLYLGDPPDPNLPYAFPLRADNHIRLPPAHIVTAEFDPLRDEGESYAACLKSAGVEVSFKRYKGMIHGFIVMHRSIDMGRQALRDMGHILKRQLF